MNNYYLRTDTEAALWEALEAADLATKIFDQDDPLNQPPEDSTEDWEPTGAFTYHFDGPFGSALDIIGLIYQPTGQTLTDDEGNEYPEMEPIPGYHANLLAPAGMTLPTITPPATPCRKWF